MARLLPLACVKNGVNKRGSVIQGHDVSGVLPEDQRRTGDSFAWPAPKGSYPWEALQGAAGDLPAGSMVQLLVADEDYDRARQLLKQWEQVESPAEPEAKPGRRFRFVAAFVFLTVGVVAGSNGGV